MPCNMMEGVDWAGVEAQRTQQQVSDLTLMLCSLCRALEDKIPLPPDVAAWYEKHRTFDAKQGRP